MAEIERKVATYYDIFTLNKYNLKDITQKSYSWYTKQAALLGRQGFTAKRVIDNPSGSHSSKVIPGKLYLYGYDPKHKDTLPYYDKFPMVFPFKIVKGGFLGLNMHYMPVPFRIKLLDKLMQIDGTKKTNRAKMQLSWELISGASSLKILGSCVHMYLNAHIKTQFREIERGDWGTAMMLPCQQFVGASNIQVWRDTMKKAGMM